MTTKSHNAGTQEPFAICYVSVSPFQPLMSSYKRITKKIDNLAGRNGSKLSTNSVDCEERDFISFINPHEPLPRCWTLEQLGICEGRAVLAIGRTAGVCTCNPQESFLKLHKIARRKSIVPSTLLYDYNRTHSNLNSTHMNLISRTTNGKYRVKGRHWIFQQSRVHYTLRVGIHCQCH
ncbi:hypothetical protein BKA93DRAFT_90839 [Sparassis latifolia]